MKLFMPERVFFEPSSLKYPLGQKMHIPKMPPYRINGTEISKEKQMRQKPPIARKPANT
jgi:hypothetical protein